MITSRFPLLRPSLCVSRDPRYSRNLATREIGGSLFPLQLGVLSICDDGSISATRKVSSSQDEAGDSFFRVATSSMPFMFGSGISLFVQNIHGLPKVLGEIFISRVILYKSHAE